jgi:hypothetical protein
MNGARTVPLQAIYWDLERRLKKMNRQRVDVPRRSERRSLRRVAA